MRVIYLKIFSLPTLQLSHDLGQYRMILLRKKQNKTKTHFNDYSASILEPASTQTIDFNCAKLFSFLFFFFITSLVDYKGNTS